MVFIYILQLEQGKYYVGKTTNYTFRLEKHFGCGGSAWTKKYKPINVLELIPDCDNFDEDKHTLKCMEKYGINNVRGGSFCEIKLSDNNIITLNQMIKGVTDKCYICGKLDHFANDCKKHSIVNPQNPTINVNEKCDCPTSYFSSHRRGKCLLNKVISYFEDENENIDKLLKLLIKRDESNDKRNKDDNKNDDNKNGDNKNDDNKNDDNKNDDNKNDDNKTQIKNITCFRCGRIGHYSTYCYASKHINGYYLKKNSV